MNYIGSKYSLLNEIEAVLQVHDVPCDGVALDLFAGTAAVAQLFKRRGHITYANDWQRYAYLTGVAFIEYNDFPTLDRLLSAPGWRDPIDAASGRPILSHSIQGRDLLPEGLPCVRVLRYLDQIPGCRGPFYEAYCCGGKARRMYFSRQNGMRIQAVRDQIEVWSKEGLISAQEKAWLVACLIESADRVANTASIYGAYLKHVKRSARKPLALVALRPSPSSHPADQHRAFCQDGLELLTQFEGQRLRLVYVDPPYNHRQYASNYHILETIACWDMASFSPRGVTGLREAEELRSDYCLRSAAEEAFQKLFARIDAEYLMFSYNNEGLLSEEKLLALFESHCTETHFRRIPFKRFRADVDHENRVYKADRTHEFLILGKPKRFAGR